MEKLEKLFIFMLIGLLQAFATNQFSVSAQSASGAYSITVTTPGTFGQVMLQQVENWSDVVDLTVNGTLNETDMAYFSRLQNMKKLDLSKTDITSIMGCKGLTELETVVLPSTVTMVSKDAFASCSSLYSINLSNVIEIGSNSFYNCTKLSGNITIEGLKKIGDEAFYRCNNIESISFPNVEEIGNSAFEAYEYGESKLSIVNIPNVKYIGGCAFQYCKSLTSIDISNCEEIGFTGGWPDGCFRGCYNLVNVKLSKDLKTIPHGCFRQTAIKAIELPTNLKVIEDYAFDGAKMTHLILPEGVENIGYEAFNNCPLVSITIPSTLISISNNAFNSTSLSDVYSSAVVPINTRVFDSDIAKSATLHVPAFSVSAYKLDDNWYKFGKVVALEGELNDVTINNNFTIIDFTGLADKANITLTSTSNSAGHLTISGGTALSLNNFVQKQNFRYERDYYYDENDNYIEYYHYPYCTTLISNSEVSSDNVTTKIQLPSNCWTFLSLPYDVNVSDIIVPEGTMWVVRKYNGANRAAMIGDTWENVINGQTLKAGEGYIFHCVTENADSWNTVYVEFEFPAANNDSKNNVFAFNDITKTLKEYPAEFSHNRGWNLIGNPYPAYYNSHSIEFNAPITVWNGSSYTAYSLADDEYVLRPNEAFFVQCPVNTNQISFAKEGRSHNSGYTSDYYRAPSRVTNNSNRQILNFVIANEQYNDRARFVVNEDAKAEYEIECDASKFMSANAEVPQIYIIDNGVNYAIDERPLGNGSFNLGVRIGSEGRHTISLRSNNVTGEVVLTDNLTGEKVNLAERPYDFDSMAKTYTTRFSIEIKADINSVEVIEGDNRYFSVDGNMIMFVDNVEVNIVTTDGKTVFYGVPTGTITLPAGIYVIRIENETYKVAIK